MARSIMLMADPFLLDRRPVRPVANRSDLARSLRSALDGEAGFAAAKLGRSEQAMLLYPTLLERCRLERQRVALNANVRFHCAVQMGMFPSDPDSILAFSTVHARATCQLDYLALVRGELEADLLAALAPPGRTIDFLDLEPDRSTPDQSGNCWLPALAGRRVLIMSSIADLLCERANRDTFEAVWAKTGKPWFAPAQVRPLQFPYAYDPDIQKRFGCSQNLLASIVERIDPASFDVALISGGSLGIPIAAAIRGMDRAAMVLGGTLQVLFGVGGRRWWNWPDWQVQYFTPAWISVPPDLVPKGAERVEGGAYWG
jgi:hypothetical protein